MTSLDFLIEHGVTRMRLPRWNEHAYLQIRDGAVWADVYDVLTGIGGGDPIPMLVADCARHTDWEALSDSAAPPGGTQA